MNGTNPSPLQMLKRTWGYESFRPLQGEIVESVLAGKDVFALLPTGAGKSLCYQLPALLLPGVTVVVSPLIALMKDQVDSLQALGVPATFINSSLTSVEQASRNTDLRGAKYKLLYVAPERLVTSSFLGLLEGLPLALIAVDEAHCISEWGHDFRPEYRRLREFRKRFPSVPWAAFTATATRRVEDDIVQQLSLRSPAQFRGSFNRKNLWYEVRSKRNAAEQVLEYLRQHPFSSGIIYRTSRAGADELALRLSEVGIKAVSYHAGLPDEQRRVRHEAFMRDEVQVVVATIAFGLGIDKPDVRFVIHYDLPKTLENYYQESGRAGRDGEQSDCLLFYSGSDAVKLRRFAAEASPAEAKILRAQLDEMVRWAETTACRRKRLLAYFGEQLNQTEDRCCDACESTGTHEIDVTRDAQMFLSCAKRTREQYGRSHVVSVLRGSRSRKVLDLGHDRLSTFGIGRHQDEEYWSRLAILLEDTGAVQANEYGSLIVSSDGMAILRGQHTVRMVARTSRDTPRRSVFSPEGSAELFEKLRGVRKRLAESANVPPYVILPDRTLRDMCERLPTSRPEFRKLEGVGEYRALAYSDSFTEAISEELATRRTNPVKRIEGMSGTVLASLKMFREGAGIDEIAQRRGVVRTTIEVHLATAILAGEQVCIDTVVSSEKRERITKAALDLGLSPLSPIKERVGESITYGEIRLVVAELQGSRGRREQENRAES